MRQEVPDGVHAAEARAPDPREGGGPVLPPVWHQGVHARLHEPPHTPQTPRGEGDPVQSDHVKPVLSHNHRFEYKILFFCVQVVFVRIDEFDDLQEPPTIDESAISIVQVIAYFVLLIHRP